MAYDGHDSGPRPRNGGNGDAARQPIIGITMGDPAGIGAEVIIKALFDDTLRRRARFVLYGLHEMFAYAADQAEISPYWFRVPHDAPRRVESGVILADFDEFSRTRPGA